MMYIGITINATEACRLFHFEHSDSENICETLKSYMHRKSTTLGLHYIDKGVFVLGYEINYTNLWKPLKSLEESIAIFQEKKAEWLSEVKRLSLDMSRVEIEYMEEGSEIVENPEPILIAV